MIKKLIYILIVLAGLLIISYFFQPLKERKGFDISTRYELVENWPLLPEGLKLGNPTGIGIDTKHNIIIFHRADRKWPLLGRMPEEPISGKTILIIDKVTGKVRNSWGDNLFIMPHGLTVDDKNNIWVTDVGLHQVFKFSYEGKLLMKLGKAKTAGNDRLHFNKPTDIAVAADGSFYVSDGYGNNRIVKFSPEGKYLFEWGKSGDKESEFDIPHAICIDKKGNLYVADRENNRIQVFDSSGRFIQHWRDNTFGAMCSVTFDSATSKVLAVDDLTFLKLKHRGSDVFIFDTTGNVQARFGRSGYYKGSTSWYHDLVTDEEGNIYIGDILGNTIQKFRKIKTH